MPLCSVIGSRYENTLLKLPTFKELMDISNIPMKIKKDKNYKGNVIRCSGYSAYSRMFSKYIESIIIKVIQGDGTFILENIGEDKHWAHIKVRWIYENEKEYENILKTNFRSLNLFKTEGRLPMLVIELSGGDTFEFISTNILRALSYTCNNSTKATPFNGDLIDKEEIINNIKDIYPGLLESCYRNIFKVGSTVFINNLRNGREMSILSPSSVLKTSYIISNRRRSWSKDKREFTPNITELVRFRRRLNIDIYGRKY
jgi:hypothetical protein